jgi:DNA gyrase subunit A
MDPGEKPIFIKIIKDYPEKHNMVFLFENGKGVRIPITSYQTKATRKKLVGAYSDASPIVAAFYEEEKKPYDLLLVNNQKKAIVVKTSLIPLKSSRTSAGSTIFTCKKGQKLTRATDKFSDHLDNTGYKKIKIPATGSAISEKDIKKIFN